MTLPAPFVVGVPRSGTTLLRLPLPARADAWRDELPAAEVEGFERIAGDTLTSFGYSRAKP